MDNKRTRELSEEELANIRQEVDKYTIEGDLRRFNNLNIKRLRDIGCYRGRRHAAVSCGRRAYRPRHIELLGLPCKDWASLCGIVLEGHSCYRVGSLQGTGASWCVLCRKGLSVQHLSQGSVACWLLSY